MTTATAGFKRLLAAGLLITGLALAVGTPLYLVHVAPSLSVYLQNPVVLVGQAVPYLVCAALWLPWRSPSAATVTLVLSAVLLFVAVVLYVPMLWTAGRQGGDMIGLAFLLVSLVTTGGVLLASVVAALSLWLRRRARRPPVAV